MHIDSNYFSKNITSSRVTQTIRNHQPLTDYESVLNQSCCPAFIPSFFFAFIPSFGYLDPFIIFCLSLVINLNFFLRNNLFSTQICTSIFFYAKYLQEMQMFENSDVYKSFNCRRLIFEWALPTNMCNYTLPQ